MEEFDTFEDGTLLNLREKSNADLRSLLDELSEEENDLSFRRRVLHGRIDILRAELVRRLADERRVGHDVISGADINRLIEILAHDLQASRDDKSDSGSPEDEEA